MAAPKKPRSHCFIKYCRKNFTFEKTSYFSAKRDEVETWRKVVPGLTRKTKICARHFDESDLIKGRSIGGVFYRHKVWRLKDGAVPKHFLSAVFCSPISPTQPQVVLSGCQPEYSAERLVDSPILITLPECNEKEAVDTMSTVSNNIKRVYFKDNSKCNSSGALITVTLNESTPSLNERLAQNEKGIEYQETDPGVTTIPEVGNNPLPNERPLSPILLYTTPICGPDHDYIATSLQHGDFAENVGSTSSSKTTEIGNTEVLLTSKGLTKEFIENLPKIVPVPTSDWFWVVNKSQCQASCSIQIPMVNQLLIKTAVITSASSVTFLANGKPVHLSNLRSTFESYEELYKIICRFHSAKLCRGIAEANFKKLKITSAKAYYRGEDGVIRSKQCTSLSIPNDECLKCKAIRFYLQRNQERLSKLSEARDMEKKAFKKKIKQLSNRLEKRREIIKDLKSELSAAKVELLGKSVNHLMQQLNPMAQTILKLFSIWASLPDKESGGHSARYPDSILNHCCLLWLKNPTTYNFLRKHKIVPLPSLTTISNYIKSNKDQLEGIESDFVRNLIGLNPKENSQTVEAPIIPITDEPSDQVFNIEVDVIVSQ